MTGRVVTALASHIDANLGRWIYGQVAFPNSMVDRITPRTTKTDIGIVTRLTGLDDAWPVTCEPFSQWVIEDRFPKGRRLAVRSWWTMSAPIRTLGVDAALAATLSPGLVPHFLA